MVTNSATNTNAEYACLIPVSVDALVVDPNNPDTDNNILPPLVDFSKLPTTDKQGAFVSRSLVDSEFQGSRREVGAGIHLHWMLPETIRRTHALDGASPQFPAAPNRWLIERIRGGQREKAWVIESDYISTTASAEGHTTIPYLNDLKQPFRYLGRALPLDEWLAAGDKGTYWRTENDASLLTAIGYGDPAFAAFYPNCQNVFGFHDPDAEILSNIGDITYQIHGWYSDPRDDLLIRHHIDFSNDPSGDYLQSLPHDLHLALPDDETAEKFSTLCFGRLEFKPDGSVCDRTINMVGMGNTGSEALAACLAHDITRDLDLADRIHAERAMQAIMLEGELRDVTFDIGAKFQQARHSSGFDAVDAGIAWSIDAISKQGEIHTSDPEANVAPNFAPTLAKLQHLQIDFNSAQAEVNSLRAQLFSDWFEFQRSEYRAASSGEKIYESDPSGSVYESDPSDSGVHESDPSARPTQGTFASAEKIKDHMLRSQRTLDQKIQNLGQLDFALDSEDQFVVAVTASDTSSLASKVAQAAAAVLVEIQANNAAAAVAEFAKDDLKYRPISYGLNKISAARYWRAKNPVLVLGGPGAASNTNDMRNAQGLTECQVVACPEGVSEMVLKGSPALTNAVKAFANGRIWHHQPWHPIMMDWAVEVFPVDRGTEGYDPDFIEDHYGLDPVAIELSSELGREMLIPEDKEANERHYYKGSCVLTRHPHHMLREQFEAYLKTIIERDYKILLDRDEATRTLDFADRQKRLLDIAGATYDPEDGSLDEHVLANISQLVSAYTFAQSVDEIEHIKAAYSHLIADGFEILSQSLGGFNQAMLQHRQVLQLPVMDPNLGDQEFVGKTDAQVAGYGTVAPNSITAFLPIRAGTLALEKLQIIDRFGQSMPIDMSNSDTQSLITPSHVDRGGHKEHHVWMSPRLSQDARLHFRWLDAGSENRHHEANSASSPICGWVIPNFLDNTLAIYDAGGTSLGAITSIDHVGARDCWRGPPGENQNNTPDQIFNPHLRRMVHATIATIGNDPSYLTALIKTCGSALHHINPNGFDQHKSTALLFGRPIAIVRASLGLELKGNPAIDRNDRAFKYDIEVASHDAPRTTLGFEDVKFPLRLGEFEQLNDGLVGYWIETEDDAGQITFDNQKFYAPQSTAPSNDYIEGYHGGAAAHLDLTLRSEPHYVTMLLDPRGQVHATTGILPTKALTIPLRQYGDALEAIEVTFEVFPILSDVNKLHLPLGDESTASWTWLAQTGDGTWPEISRKPDAQNRIHPTQEDAHFGMTQKLRDGWLKLTPSTKNKDPNP